MIRSVDLSYYYFYYSQLDVPEVLFTYYQVEEPPTVLFREKKQEQFFYYSQFEAPPLLLCYWGDPAYYSELDAPLLLWYYSDLDEGMVQEYITVQQSLDVDHTVV